MKHYLTIAICLLTLGLVAQPIKDKNILIIHSYHQGLEWTDHISDGIESVFHERSEYQLFYEYLDTKRNMSDDYMEKLYNLFKMKMSKMHFSGIIASDNAALNFISNYAKDLFPDIPIIYCGINNAEELISELPKHMYVLGERADHAGTLNLISELTPDIRNIVIVNDNSLTGRMIQKEVEAIIPHFSDRFDFEFINDFSIEELEELVSKLPLSSAIYLLVINRDNKGEFISYRRGIEIVKRNASVPIFGSWDFYLGRGIVGGMITSGQQQGAYASRQLMRILENRGTNAIPHFSYAPSVGIIDYNELIHFNIANDNLDKTYKIINQPEEENYKREFFILLGLFIFVGLLFLFLHIQRKRTNRMLEIKVNEKTQELQSIIEKKDQFLSLIAHDLRSPSGALAEGMNFLINHGVTLDIERKTKFMKELAKSANKVFSLLEDMLLWGRIQFSKNYEFNKEEQHLYKLVEEVTSVYYYDRDKKHFLNFVDENYILTADAFVLKFILRNLISNALKFSDATSPITIDADTIENYYRFWVKDEGKGMTEEVVKSIVNQKPIQTMGNKGQQSFGIGLNAVNDYLKLCGGTMTIESHIGEGACFFIYIPKKGH